MGKIFTLIMCLCIVIKGLAQEKHPTCKQGEIHNRLLETNEVYKTKYDKTKHFLESLPQGMAKTVINGANTEYHIPCVVHVIHTGGAVGSNYNPSDAAIQNFLNHINAGYSNTNDEPSTPGGFNSVNTPLRFYLAQRDELTSCSPTTGINRINYGANSTYVGAGVGTGGITDNDLKAVVHWNDLDYYNIYIVNKIDGEDGFSTVGSYTAGYAFYPILGGLDQDGMVVLAYEVGNTNSTFIHEFGHAFNLIHPFEGGNSTTCPSNANCVTDNDEVCDTDPCRLNFNCNPSGSNPCTGTAFSSSTIQYNYMAYFGCTDRFTAGQLTRMNNVIDNIRTAYKNTGAVDAPVPLPVSITAPTFNPANNNNTAGMGPTYVKVNTIEYTSATYTDEFTGSLHYIDHTCNQATTMYKGVTYPITVKTIVNPQKVAVFIDYNNDGTFTNAAPERIFTSTGTGGDYTYSGSFTVPTGGVFLNSPIRMRVIADFASVTITPTGQIQYGQAEDYSITIFGAALPVVWNGFSATLLNSNSVDLRWGTGSENNSDRFELEHSSDGIRFSTIYSVDSRGAESEVSHYSFIDHNAIEGRNYYRVKHFDTDGRITYSEIKEVNLTNKIFNLSLYPNPTNDMLNLTYHADGGFNLFIEVVDLNGRILKNVKFETANGFQNKSISLQGLEQGVYFLRASFGDQKIVKRVLKM